MSENTDGGGTTCRWCGYRFEHAQFHAQHEPVCLKRPSLRDTLAAWKERGKNYTDEFIAELVETFNPTQYGRAWQRTAALAVELLRAASEAP